MEKSIKKPILFALPLLIGVAWLYLPTWEWMHLRWTRPNTYFSHGFLIPIISLGILWLKRNELQTIKIAGSWWGLLFLLIGVIMHTASGIARVHFTSGISILFTLYGIALLITGPSGFRWWGFALFYLIFMIPWPMALVASFTLKLKLIAAEIATMAIEFVGIVLIREGSIIYFENTSMTVGDVCSGLRSLISLLAFGILWVYIIRASWRRKLLIIAALFPIALAMNVLRIFIMGIATKFFGNEFANTYLHDASGILVFVLDLLVLWAMTPAHQEPEPPVDANKASPKTFAFPYRFDRYYVCAIVILLIFSVISSKFLYQEYATEHTMYTQKFPRQFADWKVCEDQPADTRTIQILETKDILFRHYRRGQEAPVLLCLVVSESSNRKITHPPEICYSGAGWEVLRKEKIVLDNKHSANLLEIALGAKKQLVIYWYKIGAIHTENYYYHQTQAFFNFFNRQSGGAALIRVSMLVDDNVEQKYRTLLQFSKDIFPLLEKYLP